MGPVIPLAEAAIDRRSPALLVDFLTSAVRDEIAERFAAMTEKQASAGSSVDGQREYVEAMLGLQVWAHKLYGAVHASAHEGAHAHA